MGTLREFEIKRNNACHLDEENSQICREQGWLEVRAACTEHVTTEDIVAELFESFWAVPADSTYQSVEGNANRKQVGTNEVWKRRQYKL